MTLHNGCFTKPAVDVALFYVCVVCVSKVTRSVEHLNVETLSVHLDRVIEVKSAPSKVQRHEDVWANGGVTLRIHYVGSRSL